MGLLSINFGALCRAYQEAYRYSKHGEVLPQEEVVTEMFELVYTDEQLKNEGTAFIISSKAGNKYFSNTQRVCAQAREQARKIPTRLIQENFDRRILPRLEEDQIAFLLNQMKKWVSELPSKYDCMDLNDYLGVGVNDRSAKKFLAKCIHFCLLAPNTSKELFKLELFNRAPNIRKKSDPYRLVSKDIGSSAVGIRLINSEQYGSVGSKMFYSFGLVCDEIFRKCLIVQDITFANGVIEIWCFSFLSKGCKLRRLGRGDFQAAQEFVKDHETDFREKRTWNKRKLSDMVYNGLKLGKFTAYGYFDVSGKLIAYLDAKARIDGGIELGVMLVDDTYRRGNLAASLMQIFKLLFPHCRIFGGTYEENKGMCRTFKATGFSRILYYDADTMQKTTTIRERIDPLHSDDSEKDTNSVYYFAESLIAQTYQSKLDEIKQG